VKTFDTLIVELEEDGYVVSVEDGESKVLKPARDDDGIDVDNFVYPERR
jgi:hypothetical protein